MQVREYLTTDSFIERINQLPEVFAIKSDMYGIDLYASYEEYRDDEKDVRWFMTIDPKATSTFQPYDDNFQGWPEEWTDKLGTVAAEELKVHIADLIVEYIYTPVDIREAVFDATAQEALKHQLNGALRDEAFNEAFKNGRLDALHAVFETLGMEADYEAALEAYDYIKLKG